MISRFSVKKTYTVLVGVILVIVLGVVALSRMVTDLLPNMSFPYMLVLTTDPGATPEEVEAEVTAPIEAAMATTTGIREITSNSNNSFSLVILEYEQNTNMDSCVIEIQQALDQVEATFKDTIGSPTIMRINPNMIPVMAVAVSVDGMDEKELQKFVDRELAPAIESVNGAASVNATSSIGEDVINIILNQDKIDELNTQIEDAIKKQFNDARGEINSGERQINSARNEMNSGSTQLSDAINEVMSNREELYNTREDLTRQLDELESQKASLQEVADALESFVSSDEYNGLKEANSALKDLKEIPEEFRTPEVDTQIMVLENTIKEANANIKKQFEGLAAMDVSVKTYKDLPQASSKISATLIQINEGIASIKEGLAQVDSGEISLNSALSTLNTNASLSALKIGISSGQIAEAAANLNSAKSQIDSAQESAISSADLNNVLSIDTLSNLIIAQNFDMPAGYVMDDNEGASYMVRVYNSIENMDELNDLILIDMGLDDIDVIRLKDVADVELSESDEDNYAMVNGKPGVLISMQKQTGFSTGEVARNLKDAFGRLEAEHEGLHLNILMDQSVYIDIIVKSVLQNIILGAILACIVLLAFLRNFRSTIIIALSIPLSVIFAVMVMYFTGITLNIISLSGLALGIGMLVDNSIVAVENIYRLRSEGYSVTESAIKGVNEIAGAITASTLTTVSVYLPIIFTDGITRQLFQDLALTVFFTLAASLIVAVTVVPAMSGGMLKKNVKVTGKGFVHLLNGYEKVLRFLLSHKALAFLVALAILALSTYGCLSKGLNFLDMDIEANQITGSISAPEGKDYDFDTLTAKADEVVEAISDMEEIDTIGAMAGGSAGLSLRSGSGESISLYLVINEDNKKSLTELSDEILERTKNIDVDVELTTSSTDYTAMFATGMSVEIKGRNIDKLQEIAADVTKILEDMDGVEKVDDGMSDSQPELRIIVDREKAAKYNYTVAQVYALVASKMASANSATSVDMDPEEYEVYIQSKDQKDVVLDDILDISFEYTNRDGETEDIMLSDIAEFERTSTLSVINRQAQERVLEVSAEVSEDVNSYLLSGRIQEKLDTLEIPEGYSVRMTGEDETIRDAMDNLILMMILAIIFIYLIMVAQFQSLRSPFIIMFTIPLAFTGGFLALLITNQVLNVIAMLGFVMLSGLIVNNGIVLIDYINRQREEGMLKKDAIVRAGRVRLRPVLMTVLTTILSLVVIALGIGEGSRMMQPMAIVIIGGLLYGTLLTLFIVPCIYDAFHFRDKE